MLFTLVIKILYAPRPIPHIMFALHITYVTDIMDPLHTFCRRDVCSSDILYAPRIQYIKIIMTYCLLTSSLQTYYMIVRRFVCINAHYLLTDITCTVQCIYAHHMLYWHILWTSNEALIISELYAYVNNSSTFSMLYWL